MDKKITGKFIGEILNLPLSKGYYGNKLGLVDDFSNNSEIDLITFIDNTKYIKNIINNSRIKSIFTTPEIWNKFKKTLLQPIFCDDPRFYFYSLYNYIARVNYKKESSIIAESAKIHPRSFVSEYNIVIGENTVIEPNVAIFPDVEIGDNCIIGANSVIGCDDAEVKKTTKGLIRVFHDGKLIISNNVEIGANCTIDKGFSSKPTLIGNNTKIANNTLVGHSAIIGCNSLLLCCTILGSAVVGDNVRINPGAIISNGVVVSEYAIISLGSVVVENVLPYKKVTGNFAIDHVKFLRSFQKQKNR